MSAISTTELCKRIGVQVTTDDIEKMCGEQGVKPAARPEGKRAGTFWLESDIPTICRGISDQLLLLAESHTASTTDDDEL